MQTGFVEQGLWSIAFHPKFKDNGYVFVHYSSLPFNGASIVARYTVDKASPNQITKDQANKSVKVIMNVPQPYYNHYGGRIAFGPDGMLYIGRGDGGWEGDPLNAGQGMTRCWARYCASMSIRRTTSPTRCPRTIPSRVRTIRR